MFLFLFIHAYLVLTEMLFFRYIGFYVIYIHFFLTVLPMNVV